jgi:hypothetical protein
VTLSPSQRGRSRQFLPCSPPEVEGEVFSLRLRLPTNNPAKRAGKEVTGSRCEDQSRVALGEAKRRYGVKNKGPVIHEAADEEMEQDGSRDEDLTPMHFDKEA